MTGLAGSASASSVTVTERIYHNYVYYNGGKATEAYGGSDGSGSGAVPDELHGLLPANVGVSGSDYLEGINYPDWNYAVNWDVSQGYSASGNVLDAYGSTYLDILPVNATAGIDAWNSQEIQFVVSGGGASYSLDGMVAATFIGAGSDQNSKRYDFALLQWNSSASIWVTLYQNYLDDVFNHTGTLTDGLFKIVNTGAPASSVTADGSPFIQNTSWDWKFTFADAQVAADVNATPLPGAVWLMGSGLIGLIGLARRRRLAKAA